MATNTNRNTSTVARVPLESQKVIFDFGKSGFLDSGHIAYPI